MQVAKISYNDKNAPAVFTQSLKETGFGVIIDHPIKPELIESVYKEWKIFFNSDSKHDYLFDPLKQDGYFPLGSENAKDYNVLEFIVNVPEIGRDHILRGINIKIKLVKYYAM